MSLFGFFKNEEKEDTEKDYILCPSTGNKYSSWRDYGEKTNPYSIGETYGRKQDIISPNLDDYLDCHAARHVDRAIRTDNNVQDIKETAENMQNKMDTLIELNQKLLEKNKDMEERIEKLEQER